MRAQFAFAIRVSALSACALVLIGPALANPTAVARYKDWQVFTHDVSGETICYAATEATDKAPRTATHGDVWFYVTNWSTGRARNQPSLRVGYDLREDLPSKARVGRSAWNLFNVGSEAFADDDDDPQLVRAIERGSELRVESVSARGTSVAYHFSLSGSASAIDKAADTCR
ncbi:MAG: invasion associated locus B family protein [Pseudomonadota bacterium]